MKRYLMIDESPKIHSTAFVAPGANLLGGVTLDENVSVWYQCVLRGDINRIRIGAGSNIQDGTVIHVSDDYEAIVGERVSVGHRAIIHACEIGDETLVGMSAVVMDGAIIGARSIIGAGALVTKNTKVPEGSLVIGSPARVVHNLTLDEQKPNVALAEKYERLSRLYIEQGLGVTV